MYCGVMNSVHSFQRSWPTSKQHERLTVYEANDVALVQETERLVTDYYCIKLAVVLGKKLEGKLNSLAIDKLLV